MRRPNKPHVDGYEDEENCEGYYDPDESDRRGCHNVPSINPNDPCQICLNKWRAKDAAKRKAAWDAKSPAEQAAHDALIKELREFFKEAK